MRYGVCMKLIQIAAWLLFAAILFITVDPISLRPESGLPVNVERFAAFAVLGFVFATAYPRRWLLILVLVVGAAFGFELAQMLAPHPACPAARCRGEGGRRSLRGCRKHDLPAPFALRGDALPLANGKPRKHFTCDGASGSGYRPQRPKG